MYDINYKLGMIYEFYYYIIKKIEKCVIFGVEISFLGIIIFIAIF